MTVPCPATVHHVAENSHKLVLCVCSNHVFQGKLKLFEPQKHKAVEGCWDVGFTSFCNFLKAKELTDHLIKIRVRRIAPGWRVPRCVEKWHQCERARESHEPNVSRCTFYFPASVWTEPKDKHYRRLLLLLTCLLSLPSAHWCVSCRSFAVHSFSLYLLLCLSLIFSPCCLIKHLMAFINILTSR